MRTILAAVAALGLAACGDPEIQRVGDDAIDFQAAAEARLEQCGMSNPALVDFVPRFCDAVDCSAASAFDVEVCLAAIADMACSFIGTPEDCKTCGFVGVPAECRAMWIAAAHG